MRLRVMNLLRAIGALAVLGVLVVGVPALLVATVGNPLPADMPTIDEVRVVLTQNGDGFGRVLVSVLAIVVWFLWAQVVLALFVETVALLRRRPAMSLPTLPGIQPIVRQLVAAVTLSISLAGAPVLAPALGALQFEPADGHHTVTALTSFTSSSATEHRTPDPVANPVAGQAADQGGPALVLHDRTELWDLAEAAYGDGLAWIEIAAANAGRVDAGGAPLTSSTESVAAGTSIRLPGSVPSSAVASFGTHVVEPGESLWTIAADETQRRLGIADDQAVAEYWHEVVAANADTPSGDVDLIFPGDRVVLPGRAVVSPVVDVAGVIDGPPIEEARVHAESIVAQAPAEAIETEPPSTAPESSGIRRRGVTPPVSAEPEQVHGSASTAIEGDDDEVRTSAPAVLATAGGAMVAAGLVAALRRRRALQWRQRSPGRVPRRPSTEAAAFEAILAEAASQVEVSQRGNGWVAIPGDAVGRVLAAAEPGVLPSTEPIDIDLREVNGGLTPPRVTAILGTDEVTDSPLLIDVSPSTVTAVDGTAAQVATVIRQLALDLAVSERVDDIRIIAVGTASELADLERIECVASWPEACVVAHRFGAVAETGGAVVVLGVLSPDEDCLAVLSSIGAAVVGPIEHALDRIRVQGDRAIIEPAGIEAMLAALPDAEFGLVGELVDATALESDEPAGTAEHASDVPAASACPLAPGPVEVQVLGPVDVVGAAPFSSVKAVDVVAYLAFHRQGVDADQLKTWVWPSFKPPTDKAFANVMSRARTGLGVDGDGAPYLSRAGSDRLYRLDPMVTTDFDRLRGLVELADDTDEPRQQLMLLQQALALVRGIPFSGGTATSFAWADNHVRSHVEFTIDETVHRCADLALELGEYATARAAVRTGLQVIAGCEQCFRRRFLIAGADNNRQELRSAMADLERTAAAELGEPEGVDNISRDLLLLFEELDRDLVGGAP